MMRQCELCSSRGFTLDSGSPDRFEKEQRFSRVKACVCVTTCERCEGEQQVFWTDDAGYEMLQICPDCGPNHEEIRLYNFAKIPIHFEQADLQGFHRYTEAQENAWYDAAEFCENYEPTNPGILFAGPTGVGKTHLAVAMTKELGKYSVRCRFERVRDILEGYRHHYEHGELMASEYRARLCTVPVLVLDELAPLTTEWQRTVISDIIEARYAARKCIIGTTNLAPAEITDMFGECGKRVMSRLEEMTRLVIVTGPDARTTMTEGGHVEASS